MSRADAAGGGGPGSAGRDGAGTGGRGDGQGPPRPDLEELRRAVEAVTDAPAGGRGSRASGARASGARTPGARTSGARTPRARAVRGRRGLAAGADEAGADEAGADEAGADVDPPTPLGTSAAGAGPDDVWGEEGDGTPVPAEGGIVAATRRGRIGRTWWSRRFLDALEAALAGGLAARGRSYARKGQVLDLRVDPGVVEARVQGSRQEPYRVRLVLPVVPAGDWDRLVPELGAHAALSARMLAGDLPREVEDVFDAQGASLLPGHGVRLVAECTCPDWESPCTHVAAVSYLLAERVDEDPFDLLAWRGRTRAELLGQLREIRGAAARAATGGDPRAEGAAAPVGAEVPAAARDFWLAGDGLAQARAMPRAGDVPDAALRQLPRDVVRVGAHDVADVLAPLYACFTAEAARRARR